MSEIATLEEAFEKLYGKKPHLFSAPGRVNLIGEHTDYNDGFVLPMAVNRRTFVAAARREDRRVEVHSFELDQRASFDLNSAFTYPEHWLSYIEGVARVLEGQGVRLVGADLAISSSVPLGSGLSSSAALEIAAGRALLALAGQEMDRIQLAVAAQRAEYEYAGTRCGIMDQLTTSFGQEKHALLIDCRSLQITPILLNIPDVAFVVCNTNIKHELASSAYNQRRAECEQGVKILREKLPAIRALRDVRLEDFEKYADALPEAVRRRCHHVITENERTLRAADALREGDLASLGELMALSHRSLKDDYEVSCKELDLMVELAMKHEGVSGARMTGGGFGGCTINLVRLEALNSFQNFMAESYERATGIRASLYLVEADNGAAELKV